MIKKTNIPLIDLGHKGYDIFYIKAQKQGEYLFNAWRDYFGTRRLKYNDFISKLMLINKNFLYKNELNKIKNRGMYSLNFNHYLGCTTGIKNGILYRTLDVSAPALGETLHRVQKESPVGIYHNLTWPGFIGVATAVAPNRFALAYNEAPQPRWSFLNIIKIIRSKNIPPLWLSRQAMENCKNYAQAKDMLTNTPLCTSAIYTLMGNNGEGCVIERTPHDAVVQELGIDGYLLAGNHWKNNSFKGVVHSSKKMSIERCIFMDKFLKTANSQTKPFAWLNHPIANDTTRFACELRLNSKNGKIDVRIL